jgi:uncharacterized protein YjbI with pentapeptide repeats
MIRATKGRAAWLSLTAALALATGALGVDVDGLSGEAAIELLTRSYRCTGCDFTNAQLGAANLEGAPLQGSNFTGANLAGVNLSNADLTGADLSNADLSGADLRRATFANATLRGTRFNDARLLETLFTGAQMTGAVLAGANIRSADFSGVIGLSLAGALQQCGTILANGSIENSGCQSQVAATTSPVETVADTSTGPVSTAATGSGVSTANVATLLATNACPGCDLSSQNLRIQDLSNADLSNANLSETDFRNANLSNANLSNANLQGTVLSGTDLTDANLTGATMLNNGVGYIYCRTTLPNGQVDNSDCSEAHALSDAANRADANDRERRRNGDGGSGVGRFLGGLLGALVGVEPTQSDNRGTNITPNLFAGTYQRIPMQNATHSGAIRQGGGGWFWINDANQRWSLTPDLGNNRLLTGPENPFSSAVQRDFELVFANGQITGFRFLGELYDRTSFGQAGK